MRKDDEFHSARVHAGATSRARTDLAIVVKGLNAR